MRDHEVSDLLQVLGANEEEGDPVVLLQALQELIQEGDLTVVMDMRVDKLRRLCEAGGSAECEEKQEPSHAGTIAQVLSWATGTE